MKKICIITGTRAEYGLLKNILLRLQEESEFELQLIVTGTHLSHEFGQTYKIIEDDGFKIDEKIEMLLSGDTPTAVIKSLALATIGFSSAFERLSPDLLIILGDRYEMLAAAQVALIMQIPIGHIAGGENTFGAYDDAIRHSISKMATWHFTSTEAHRNRVIQLGEHPDRVFNVGAAGIENIYNMKLMSKDLLYEELNLNKEKPIYLITLHSETNSFNSRNSYDVIDSLLNCLINYNVNLVFTRANADNGGREINKKIEEFVKHKQNAYLFDSLGQLRYLSTVKYADLVIGNSSSGLVEVPYLETPTVNIGDRQKGREHPNSVFNVGNEEKKIHEGIKKALEFKGPYEKIFGDGQCSFEIIEILKMLEEFKVEKGFYNI